MSVTGISMRQLTLVAVVVLCAAWLVVPVPASAAPPSCAGRTATIVGTSRDDRLIGTDRADVIVGLSGHDRIEGRGGNDLICGGYGRDSLYGGLGHDDLYGHAGIDYLSGGPGFDELHGGTNPGAEALSGGAGADLLYGDAGRDVLFGGLGHDRLLGGYGNDTHLGGPGDDRLLGGPGDDGLIGDEGSDYLSGGTEWDSITVPRDAPARVDLAAGWARSGDTTDTVSSIEEVVGSRRNDVLLGDEDDNILLGFEGDDRLVGRSGADKLMGGDEFCCRGEQTDPRTGYWGNDIVYGQAGDDVMVGALLYGGLGHDTLSVLEILLDYRIDSGPGHDQIRIWWPDGPVAGGDGRDTLEVMPPSDDLGYTSGDWVFDLPGETMTRKAEAGGPQAISNALTGIEDIVAGGGNDVLLGDSDNNELIGNYGADDIRGGGGTDILRAHCTASYWCGNDTEPDTLRGGPDDDTCYQGAGDTVTECETVRQVTPQ